VSEILAWDPVLWTARALALIVLLGSGIAGLKAFGLYMTGRLPFRKVSGFGIDVEFNRAQDEQLKALEERLSDLEQDYRTLFESYAATLKVVQRLEAQNVGRTEAGSGALGSGPAGPEETGAAT
jgi:hypothetical protein